MNAIANSSTGSDKDAVARKLAESHRSVEPDIVAIYRITAPGKEDDPNEPIKLLEVNPNTTIHGIVPVGLGPHAPSGVPYSSIIVEIHTSEFPQLNDGSLKLPHGWILSDVL